MGRWGGHLCNAKSSIPPHNATQTANLASTRTDSRLHAMATVAHLSQHWAGLVVLCRQVATASSWSWHWATLLGEAANRDHKQGCPQGQEKRWEQGEGCEPRHDVCVLVSMHACMREGGGGWSQTPQGTL